MFQLRKRQRRTTIPLVGMVIICLLMFSCTIKKDKSAAYYPIDSLLDSQVKILIDGDASISKISSIGTAQSKNQYKPKDSLGWEKELAVLREIDVFNKRKGLYQVDRALTDPKSNLKVDVFTATENLPVHSVRIYYQNSSENIRKIEAVLREDNPLYSSTKNLNLEFQDINQHVMLTGYAIEGSQKMYLKDSVQYKIAVAITIAN